MCGNIYLMWACHFKSGEKVTPWYFNMSTLVNTSSWLKYVNFNGCLLFSSVLAITQHAITCQAPRMPIYSMKLSACHLSYQWKIAIKHNSAYYPWNLCPWQNLITTTFQARAYASFAYEANLPITACTAYKLLTLMCRPLPITACAAPTTYLHLCDC